MAASLKSHSFLPLSHSALMSPVLPSHSSTAEVPSPSPSKSTANNRRSTDSEGHLLPQPAKSPELGSPTSVGLSPIAPSSNGTDIDDTATEEEALQKAAGSFGGVANTALKRASVTLVTRDEDGNTLKDDSPEANPASVIHAPQGYLSFPAGSPPSIGRSTPTPATATAPAQPEPQTPEQDHPVPDIPLASPPPIDTAVKPVHDPFVTPRATTRGDIEVEERRRDKGKMPGLENIPEDSAVEDTDDERPQSAFFESEDDRLRRSSEEVAALNDTLSKCWTLCGTMVVMSSRHRERTFRQAKREDKREQAWKACWTLCQKLYETRDEDSTFEAGPTLDMCRDFCQSLFEVRQKGDEMADSVLRVSFELNNHLYNTHDRNLPDAYRERTLDFYITLCHRLMKQRNAAIEEADSLLRACWGLAEMLFSLRQNRREARAPNEELLGSAVQACWELCDLLFREDSTQVRLDRGTPRPSSFGFSQFSSSSRIFDRPNSVATINIDESSDEENDPGRLNPETPTTIFEDTNQFSPDDASVPNILVLGPETSQHPLPPWSSSASDVESHYSSASSHRSRSSSKIEPGPTSASSTSTVMNLEVGPDGATSGDAARLACLKLLIVRAAQLTGFDRAKNPSGLQNFVKSAPSSSFGTAPWQTHLLSEFKKLIASDLAFRSAGPPTRASVYDIARAVRWMVRSGQYVWLEDLYRWVLGFRVEEATDRKNVWMKT